MILSSFKSVVRAVRSRVVTSEETKALESDASKPDWKRRGLSLLKQWSLWLFVLIVTVCAGVWLIPLFRSWPADVHKFFNKLHPWQQISFTLFVCASLAIVIANLFQPRFKHLWYFFYCPPQWMAVIAGVICVATLDLKYGLAPDAYKPKDWEWPFYAVGAVTLAFLYRAITHPLGRPNGEEDQRWKRAPNPIPSDWAAMERWLASDTPAEHDILGRQFVAERIAGRLLAVNRSIGIVGPYGSGKTSIVRQVELITKGQKPKLLFSKHSCWGFENSATAIHAMLAGGLEEVRKEIDVSHVTSLPESYRQTFSAGGEWLGNISKLVLGDRSPSEQFERLSILLRDMGARLVFVVEDLDRNDSESFDIEEVQAFLFQLKEFENLAFILTGNTSPTSGIDFAKLCEVTEYLLPVHSEQSGPWISQLRDYCLNQSQFPHEVLTQEDDNPWKATRWLLLSHQDAIWPPEAIARLLNTPRVLKRVLKSTYHAWKEHLAGEIDWDHLLAVNALRHSAPEAFLFMFRHWKRFNSHPRESSLEPDELEQVRITLRTDWEASIRGVEWDQRAARSLIAFVLPETGNWIDGSTNAVGNSRRQGVSYERYWHRAIDGGICEGDICDQRVAIDLRHWCESPNGDSNLPKRLCASETYGLVWEDLAGLYLRNDRRRILLLAEQVLDLIGSMNGSEASVDSHGFVSVWRFTNRHVGRTDENRLWLEERLTQAASHSLQLVNDLWHYWGWGSYSIIPADGEMLVRQHILSSLQAHLADFESLRRVVSSSHPYVLYQLVFDAGNDDAVLNEASLWSWLGPPLLQGLEAGDTAIAVAVSHLVAFRVSKREETFSVAPAALFGIFGNDAEAATIALQSVASQSDDGFLIAIAIGARSVYFSHRQEFLGDAN